MQMKKSLYIISAVLLLLLGSCTKEESSSRIAGQWNLTDLKLTTKSAEIGSQKVDIYIDSKNDNSYEMYQMLGQGRYRYFKGAYKLEGDILKGNYHEPNSVSEWGNSYRIELSGDKLIMTALVESSDVYTYTKTTIPDEVKSQAVR